MNAVKLKLVQLHSIELEVGYVKYLVSKLPWYAEQGYIVKLPKGIDASSSGKDIERAVQEEYVKADYESCVDGVMSEWVVVSSGFDVMREVPAFHLENEYRVVLTKYGIGGSYNSKLNQITVRINTLSHGKMVSTVVHEIVHTAIQYLIDKYKVSHWRKERLVDLLVEHYFPELKKMQNIKEDVSIVDSTFSNLFPDIDSVAETIGDI